MHSIFKSLLIAYIFAMQLGKIAVKEVINTHTEHRNGVDDVSGRYWVRISAHATTLSVPATTQIFLLKVHLTKLTNPLIIHYLSHKKVKRQNNAC